MPKDFLSSQIKVDKIIGSNDQGNPKLIVYPSLRSTDNTGGINPSMISGAGTDSFVFISGSISGKRLGVANSVSIFGGDLVVSGALYAENSLYAIGNATFNTTQSGDSDFIIKTLNKDFGLKIDSQNDTIQFMSGGSPTSPDESRYEDTNFFVSGSIGSAHQPERGQTGNGEKGTGVFGGDLFVSGSLWAKDINLTNASIGGQVISLKGYVENGDFDARSTVVGTDSISLGHNNTLESNKSFILGSFNNSILGKNEYSFNTIIGSSDSEISGSYRSIVLGGTNNTLHNTSPSYLAFTNNAEVYNAEVAALFSNNLYASGSVSNTIVMGHSNRIEGTLDSRTKDALILGKNNEVLSLKRSFILNLSNESVYNPDNANNPTPKTSITGSDNTFLISRGSDTISGSLSNTLFIENSDLAKIEDSFINGKNNLISDVKESIIFGSDSVIKNSNNLVSIGGKSSSFSDDEVNSINSELLLRGISSYVAKAGFNTSLGGEYTSISGSYNNAIGGINNNISGSFSSIFGSINSSITNSSGSVIIGGIQNIISNNKNIVIGSDNVNTGERSFSLGNNIQSNNDDVFIIGSGNRSKETSLVLSASKFEFGDLTPQKVYGNDTNFFVSGSVGARERFLAGSSIYEDYYGVAVFGGDLHVSGNISGGNFELYNLFFEGGEAKGVNRSLGNTDEQDLTFLTKGLNRVTIDGVSGSLNVGGMLPSGQQEHTQIHIRTGSFGSYQFDSSLDNSSAASYPLLISRNVQQQINEETPLEVKEVGMAFSSYPTLSETSYHSGIKEEPGAAITHKITGRNSKGNLLFKTKTTEGQISIGEAGSLTTKLTITSDGEMLLGNDNPQGNYIDLRVKDSEWPLIQASGSTPSGRIISIGENKNNTKGLNQEDTIFHVYGLPGSKLNLSQNRLVSSFGGDVVVSGSLFIEEDIDITGSIKIQGDIDSKDSILNISSPADINLNADNYVYVKNNLEVENNITASHIKGDGLEISNVNKSSIWTLDKDSNGNVIDDQYIVDDFIDGNTGVWMIDLRSTFEEFGNGNLMNDGKPQIVHAMTNNTRLYDTYFEIEKNSTGQVKYVNSDSNVEGVKPIETERVESPEQLTISLK
jgi:hypothetical protein